MFITFVRDVTVPGWAGGPHYVAGYICDVSDEVGRAHIAAGDAMAGKVKILPPKAPLDAVLREIPANPEPRGISKKGKSRFIFGHE